MLKLRFTVGAFFRVSALFAFFYPTGSFETPLNASLEHSKSNHQTYTYLLDERLHYPDGQLQSKKRYYIDNSTNIQEKILHGVYETFYQNGSIDTKTLFEHGTEKEHSHWSHDGRLRLKHEFSLTGSKSSHYFYGAKGDQPILSHSQTASYGAWGSNQLLPEKKPRFLYEEVIYFPDGRLVQERSKYYYEEVEGEITKVLHGSQEEYRKNGYLKKFRWFFHGEPLSGTDFLSSFNHYQSGKRGADVILNTSFQPSHPGNPRYQEGFDDLTKKEQDQKMAEYRLISGKGPHKNFSLPIQVNIRSLRFSASGLVFEDGRKEFHRSTRYNRFFIGIFQESENRDTARMFWNKKSLTHKESSWFHALPLEQKKLYITPKGKLDIKKIRSDSNPLPQITHFQNEIRFLDQNGDFLRAVSLP